MKKAIFDSIFNVRYLVKKSHKFKTEKEYIKYLEIELDKLFKLTEDEL